MLSGGDLLELARVFDMDLAIDSYDDWIIDGRDTIILYPWLGEENIGHWVAFFNNKEGNNYFDSYGGYPDELIVDGHTNPYAPKLAEWMINEKDDINYNPHNYQKEGNSCGVWSFIRIYLKTLSDKQFYDVFSKWTSDDVTDLLIQLTKQKKRFIAKQ